MATTAGSIEDRLEAGRRALEEGEWEAARLAFEAVLEAEESAEAYESLGWATWWLADEAAVFAARESAYRLYRADGDEVAAARVAVWLAADHREFRGEVAIGRGWLERAEQLLANRPECPEHGWLALIQADFAQNVDRDMAATEALAHRAADLGRRLEAVDLETVGLALEGMSMVAGGDFEAGMRKLDEAGTIVTGEVSEPIASGWALCCLISACDAVGDFDRASQWCDRLREIAERWGVRQMVGVCRTTYGRVLATRGRWGEAEAELEGAVSDFRASRPGMEVVGLVRLAELRARQGSADEARELFDRCGPAGLVGLGYLELDRGEPDTAAQLADRVLRRLPATATLDRLPALELSARAHAAGEQPERREGALRELEVAARPYPTPYICGRVHSTRGDVATAGGDYEEARTAYEDAIDCFHEAAAPYEEAIARLGLARALQAAGRHQRASTEAESARAAFNRLGAGRDTARAEDLLVDAGAEAGRSDLNTERAGSGVGQPGAGGAAAADSDGADRLSGREIEVLRLIAAGMSDAEIAEELTLSPHTVHRHVANIRTKLDLGSRTAAVAYATRAGLI